MSDPEAIDLCGVCGYAMSTRKPEWSRLARPDGGYDHTHCALGINTYGLQAIRREGRAVDQEITRTRTRPREWMFWKNLGDGSWRITCSLCGKHFNRVFRPGKYEEPKRAASDYAAEHLASASHHAAIDAYKMPITELPEESLLRTIFGKEDQRSDEAKRIASARDAAHRALRGKGS